MIESDTYCRDIEAYLCRKNDGHLVRIVGPGFEIVSGWARQGVPLKVACAGIDRYFERYYRRGPRRRPVRVEFCEADVLDAFDDWRRAVGLSSNRSASASDADASAVEARQAEAGGEDAEGGPARSRRGPSLAAHVEQVMARLTLLRGSAAPASLPDEVLAAAVRSLDTLKADVRRARGDAREAIVAALADVEGRVIAAAQQSLDAQARSRLAAEADKELAPFRARMASDAYARSRQAALVRLVREQFLLPRIAYE